MAAVDLSQFAGKYPQPVLDAAAQIFASKPDQIAAYQNDYGGDFGKWLNAFQGFWTDPNNTGSVDLNQYGPESALMGALGYDVNPAAAGAQASLNTTGGGVPADQYLFQTALPGLLNDINNDANRQGIASTLTNSILTGANAANTQLARTQGGHFDSATYFNNYPQVAAQFNALPAGTAAGTKSVNGQDVTADQWAEQQYLTQGQQQGNQPAYVQSAQLAQDFNNANQTVASNVAASNQATQTQLASLATATQQLQQNLTGDLQAKAAALATNIASLQQNATTLDAAQRANLTQQIATQQQDLEASIGTQRQALQDQLTALGNAAGAQADAQRTALNQEIQGLTAAQAPLNTARSAAAQLQATAVNVGLQRTQDQLTAQNALNGYVGGSTGQDAALARATIDARQNAAQAVGAADTQNAQDTRDIGVQGATGQRSIADALSAAQAQIAAQGATGNAALTGALATGRQSLSDTQAAGLAGIGNNTALAQAGIGAYGANTTYSNAAAGADQSRSIADALAQGQNQLTATNALNTQAAQQQGAAAKATYYDNDYNRTLSAALAPTTIASNAASALTGLDNYGTSGLNRSLATIYGNFATNPTTPPTPGAVATQPNTTGNSLSTLGAGVLSGALNIGAANNPWWLGATKSAPTSSDPLGTTSLASNLSIVCWVARVVYGERNPRWLAFRGWMLAEAPAYLREFYVSHGARIAEEVRRTPSRIAALRATMDAIIEGSV